MKSKITDLELIAQFEVWRLFIKHCWHKSKRRTPFIESVRKEYKNKSLQDIDIAELMDENNCRYPTL